MRKVFIHILSLLLVIFTACEYNEENFPELADMVIPTDIQNLVDSLTAEDYATIAGLSANKALAEAEGVSDELQNLKSSQVFSDSLSAAKYLPAYIASIYPTLDNTSSIKVTYNYLSHVPDYITKLSGADIYTVSNEDYKSVWNNQEIYYFTPKKSLAKNANDILSATYSEAEEGEIKVLAYNYSDQEPADYVDPAVTSINEDFSATVDYEAIEISGWTNYAEAGDGLWEARSYDDNSYAQFSAYKAGGEAIAWLISPEIDMSEVDNPTFSFDVKLGFFNGYVMQVLISEDYSDGNPTEATWIDITKEFGIYGISGSYTDSYVAGVYDLSAYKDNNFHIAFRYAGDDTADKTTTYQIDNIQVGGESDIIKTGLYSEDFSGGIDNWYIYPENEDADKWSVSDYKDIYRAEFSAYGKTGEQETWLVSPGISVPDNNESQLLVDMAVGYYNYDCLSILISEDFTDDINVATWVDITDKFTLAQSASGYSDIESIGAFVLNEYKGKNIFVAFKYVGNADEDRTTTYQIYNFDVVSYSHSAAQATPSLKSASSVEANNYAIYSYDGSAWKPYSSAIILDASDYQAMGISYFSSDDKTEDYLPNFLKSEYPYAKEEDAQTVVFLFGSNSDLSAEDYVFSNGSWTKVDDKEVVTDQFVKNAGKWVWVPSVVINLGPIRNDEFIMSYYQAVTDWVWDNIDVPSGAAEKGDGFVSSYGNNDYYSGASAYYNNVDMRPQNARNQAPDYYGDLSDEEISALMMEHLAEAMGEALSVLHADAEPIDGVDVTYTVNVAIYTGETISDVTHSIVYKVVGSGEFELLSGPDPIEE